MLRVKRESLLIEDVVEITSKEESKVGLNWKRRKDGRVFDVG